MSRRLTLAAIAFISCLTVYGSPSAASTGPSTSSATLDWRSDVTQHAQQLIDAGLFPGMGLAITRGDRVIYVGSFGVADMKTERRVKDTTRFYIASTTKALTATAVVLEASRGTLRLDAAVTRYIPNLHFKPPLKADSVALRALLSMTDGIGDCFPAVFRTAYTGVFTRKLLIQLLGGCGPSKTGHAFSYRNLPYNILGLVLNTNGQKNGWKQAVRRDVLDPLDMDETTAYVSTLDPADIAMPHEAGPNGFRRIRLAKADSNLHAAGGHFTTARDLAKFIAVHASDGMLNGKRIFPATVIASTHAKHANQDRDFGPYHRYGWGYGWDLGTFEGHEIVHRFGSFAGYRSHASFMPDSGVGVVILVNGIATRYALDRLADYIYDRLRSKGAAKTDARYQTVFKKVIHRKATYARHFAKELNIRRARQQERLLHPLKWFAGEYDNPTLGKMVWQLHDGQLEVSAGVARSNAEIYAAAKNQLRVELTGGGEVVTFQFPDNGGPAQSLTYNGYVFERARSPMMPQM